MPGCPTIAGGIEIPANVDVTMSASFLTEEGEPDPHANAGSGYRLSGNGTAEPALTATSSSVTRVDAFSLALHGTSAASGSITLSLVHTRSGNVVWGPCSVPVSVVAPEATPAPWATVAASPQSSGGHFQDASFISDLKGFVIGAPGEVYYTGDGGISWEKRYEIPATSPASLFRSVAFVSETKGWVGDLNRFNNPVPGRSLWETTDGGRTWTNISNRISGPPVTGICGMWVIDANTIVGVGRWNGPAAFVKTQDAGATWQSVALAPLLTGAVDVFFFNAQSGLIAGARGVGNSVDEQNASRLVILATGDGGATWTERFVGSQLGAWSWKISFPTPTVGYIATQGPTTDPVILKTVDGGITWREISIEGVTVGFWGAGFSSALTGWVGGNDGVWETRDGGLTWSRVQWAGSQSINRFRMLANGSAIAVGKQIHRQAP